MEDPTLEQVEAPEGGCGPMGIPCWSRLLAGPVDPWREDPTPESTSGPEMYPAMTSDCHADPVARCPLANEHLSGAFEFSLLMAP
ncbi:tRNA:m(4)X modification enzyme TRM13 [Grus japonensis]|uniref:tRNA:m(4)X modification enzyme TRM13 n=1 Tax=Grus japonensis TaxID=30415 RepID=A0ABC9XPG4_GRUJA